MWKKWRKEFPNQKYRELPEKLSAPAEPIEYKVLFIPEGHGSDDYEPDEPDAYSIIALIGDKEVGKLDINVTEKIIHIRWMLVDIDWRRKGIASKLLDKAVELFPEREVDTSGFTDAGERWWVAYFKSPDEGTVLLTEDTNKEKLLGYLKFIAESSRRLHTGTKDWEYGCMEEFILKNGRMFETAPLPKGIRKGKQGQCYMNATNLMHRGYTYVEGYALQPNLIPLMHAWCVDDSGKVIDNTWKYHPETAYYGVPFDKDFVIETILRRKMYGVIDDWEGHWPLLTKPKTDFKAKAFAADTIPTDDTRPDWITKGESEERRLYRIKELPSWARNQYSALSTKGGMFFAKMFMREKCTECNKEWMETYYRVLEPLPEVQQVHELLEQAVKEDWPLDPPAFEAGDIEYVKDGVLHRRSAYGPLLTITNLNRRELEIAENLLVHNRMGLTHTFSVGKNRRWNIGTGGKREVEIECPYCGHDELEVHTHQEVPFFKRKGFDAPQAGAKDEEKGGSVEAKVLRIDEAPPWVVEKLKSDTLDTLERPSVRGKVSRYAREMDRLGKTPEKFRFLLTHRKVGCPNCDNYWLEDVYTFQEWDAKGLKEGLWRISRNKALYTDIYKCPFCGYTFEYIDRAQPVRRKGFEAPGRTLTFAETPKCFEAPKVLSGGEIPDWALRKIKAVKDQLHGSYPNSIDNMALSRLDEVPEEFEFEMAHRPMSCPVCEKTWLETVYTGFWTKPPRAVGEHRRLICWEVGRNKGALSEHWICPFCGHQFWSVISRHTPEVEREGFEAPKTLSEDLRAHTPEEEAELKLKLSGLVKLLSDGDLKNLKNRILEGDLTDETREVAISVFDKEERDRRLYRDHSLDADASLQSTIYRLRSLSDEELIEFKKKIVADDFNSDSKEKILDIIDRIMKERKPKTPMLAPGEFAPDRLDFKDLREMLHYDKRWREGAGMSNAWGCMTVEYLTSDLSLVTQERQLYVVTCAKCGTPFSGYSNYYDMKERDAEPEAGCPECKSEKIHLIKADENLWYEVVCLHCGFRFLKHPKLKEGGYLGAVDWGTCAKCGFIDLRPQRPVERREGFEAPEEERPYGPAKLDFENMRDFWDTEPRSIGGAGWESKWDSMTAEFSLERAPDGRNIRAQVYLVVCGDCGIPFSGYDNWHEMKYEDEKPIAYCPNCKSEKVHLVKADSDLRYEVQCVGCKYRFLEKAVVEEVESPYGGKVKVRTWDSCPRCGSPIMVIKPVDKRPGFD